MSERNCPAKFNGNTVDVTGTMINVEQVLELGWLPFFGQLFNHCAADYCPDHWVVTAEENATQ